MCLPVHSRGHFPAGTSFLPSLNPSIDPAASPSPSRVPNLPNRRQEGVPGNACPVRQSNTTSTFTSISAIHQAVLSQLANRLDTLPMATFRRHHRHAEDAGRYAVSSCDWSARGLRQRLTLPREDHDRVQQRPLRQPPLDSALRELGGRTDPRGTVPRVSRERGEWRRGGINARFAKFAVSERFLPRSTDFLHSLRACSRSFRTPSTRTIHLPLRYMCALTFRLSIIPYKPIPSVCSCDHWYLSQRMRIDTSKQIRTSRG